LSDITVVISNFNYAHFVNSAIESCLAQTVPCKIIVVDDASTDNSMEVIKNYKKYGVMSVRLKENSGGNARGKNVGICLASTKYITCLDADDMLLPDSLKLRMLFSEDIDFVHGWSHMVKCTDDYKSILKTECVPKFVLDIRTKKLMKEAEFRWTFAIEASTVLARRELYEKFGLYDEEMRWTIDREMWHRWLINGVKKRVVPHYVSFYRRHPGQLTQDPTKKNPKICNKMLSKNMELRKNITPENTMLMEHYDYQSFIDEAK